MSKKTLIIGATTDQSRYAWLAAERLTKHGHEIVPLGIKTGEVFGKEILKGQPKLENVDTVTLYIGPAKQPYYYDYIIGLMPKRVIFNPGTENDEFINLLEKYNIEVVEGCTLVMLGTGQF